MPRTRRLFTALTAAAALTTAVLVAPGSGVPASGAAAPVVLQAGPDFASNTFQDPWDMSNALDLNLDPNLGTLKMTNARMSGGVATFTAAVPAFVNFVTGGVNGSLPWGRDARLGGNQVIAANYTHLHLHIASSVDVYGRVFWGNSHGAGGIYISMKRGWNDIDVPLSGPHNGMAWSGMIGTLRLDVMARGTTTLTLDYVRLYQPVAAGVLSWSASGSTPLMWSDGSGLPNANGDQHGGPVPGAVSNGRTVQTDLSGFPPGSVFYVGSSDTPIATLAREPLPIVDSPSGSGCGDYAVSALGHPWTFSSVRSLAGMVNVTGVHFTATHALIATNGPPARNDPHVLLPLGRGGIDGRVWHRLTIVESYAGGFSLANAPGGGAVARVFWQDAGQRTFALTNDLVTPSGTQTIVLDMAMRTSDLVEPSVGAAQKYPFATTAHVTALRWDPNEDPGARTWTLYSVRLAADCTTRSTFTMTWHDQSFVPGSTATILAHGTGGVFQIGTVAERSGMNSLRIPHLPKGRYQLRLTVHTPQGAAHRSESGGWLIVTA